MRFRTLVVVALLASVLGAWTLLARPAIDDSPPTTSRPTEAADADRATLRGRVATPASPTEMPWLALLVRDATSGSTDERHAALRAIRKHHEAGTIPIETVLAWALRPAPVEGHDALAAWAREILAAGRPATLELLPVVLRAGLGASEAQQSAVADTLRRLERVRAVDVPDVLALFRHAKTQEGVKRALVDVLDGLGASALPLADALVEFGLEVFEARNELARMLSGVVLHTSHDHLEYDLQRLLAAMGPDVVPRLAARLEVLARRPAKDEDGLPVLFDDPRGFVAGALAAQGPEGRRALLLFLGHADPDVRWEIAWALGSGDAPLDPARFLDPLQTAAGDPEARIRRAAVAALGRCGEAAVEALLHAAVAPSPDVRTAAVERLAALGVDAGRALPPLTALLGSGDVFAALSAAEALTSHGPEAVAALDALWPHLDTDDVWFRRGFARAAAKIAIHDPGTLERAWDRADARLRTGLLQVIRTTERTPHAWEDLLERGLEDADADVRARSAALLAARGRRDVLPALVTGFRAEDGETRTLATAALAHFDRGALPLLPEMLERLGNEDALWHPPTASIYDRVSEEHALDDAIRAVGRYDLERMFERLEAEDFDVRWAAAAAFRDAGPAGIEWLARVWDDASPTRRLQVIDTVREVGLAEEATPARDAARHLLVRALDDPGPRVRLRAAEALVGVASHRDRCVNVLAELLAVDDLHAARTAGARLMRQGAAAAAVEATLRRHVDHPDAETRGYVRRTLEAVEDAR